jgi:hypothetical protein
MVVGEDVKSDVGSGAHPPSFDIVKFMGAQARQHNPGIFFIEALVQSNPDRFASL